MLELRTLGQDNHFAGIPNDLLLPRVWGVEDKLPVGHRLQLSSPSHPCPCGESVITCTNHDFVQAKPKSKSMSSPNSRHTLQTPSHVLRHGRRMNGAPNLLHELSVSWLLVLKCASCPKRRCLNETGVASLCFSPCQSRKTKSRLPKGPMGRPPKVC